MARSTYIYIPVSENHNAPVSAFTVKYELVNWLRCNKWFKGNVLRMSDGARTEKIDELFTNDLRKEEDHD